MTDKQIKEVFKNGFYCIEPCPEIKELLAELKRKEQECERLKEKFQDMKKSRDVALKEYNEEFEYKRQITVEHLEQKKELLKQLDQLKAENENWQKEYWKLEQGNDFWAETNSRLKQNLTEIKELCQKHIKAEKIVMANDILQKISECEGNDVRS